MNEHHQSSIVVKRSFRKSLMIGYPDYQVEKRVKIGTLEEDASIELLRGLNGAVEGQATHRLVEIMNFLFLYRL